MAIRKTTSSTASTSKASATKSPAKAKRTASAKVRTASPGIEKQAASGEEEAELVTLDRRRGGRREGASVPVAPTNMERRTKVQRRRQIDPTTCERDYSDDEVQFMAALDDYKRKNGRMFPTCSEVLEVIRGLGYVKLSPAELAVVRPIAENTAADEVEVTAESEAEFEFETA